MTQLRNRLRSRGGQAVTAGALAFTLAVLIPQEASRAQDSFTGPVTLMSPSNNSTVTVGTTLWWQPLANAATYRVCLKKVSSMPPTAGDIGGCNWGSSWISSYSYSLTANELANLGSGTAYWTVTACTQGNTACTYHYNWRSVQISYGNPQVSFSKHLYPIIASRRCSSCHPSADNSGPYFPQNQAGASGSCRQKTIPFSSSISAGDMRGRFFCLQARSTEGAYQQALGKVYVVPGQPSSSGLHWKALASTAPVFGESVTINGISKPIRDWITIWIEQGAYH